MKGGHVQVGLITSNLWLVLSSFKFVHCMSVVPIAMYYRIERCVSQPQLALAFQLVQPLLHALNDWNFHVTQWWQWICCVLHAYFILYGMVWLFVPYAHSYVHMWLNMRYYMMHVNSTVCYWLQ